MDVVLLQDVEKVGLRGEVVSVSRGFMRNYLQPRKLAEPATPALLTEIQRRDAERARHEARSVDQAHAIAETLTKTVLRFEVKAGTQGVLFGSITPTDVADELWRVRKVRVDRRKVDLPEPIKRVGRYSVPIEVFQDVRVEVKTLVVPEGGELPDEDFDAVDTDGQSLEPASADEAAGTDEATGADDEATGADDEAAGAHDEAAGAHEAALLEQSAAEPADAELGVDARER